MATVMFLFLNHSFIEAESCFYLCKVSLCHRCYCRRKLCKTLKSLIKLFPLNTVIRVINLNLLAFGYGLFIPRSQQQFVPNRLPYIQPSSCLSSASQMFAEAHDEAKLMKNTHHRPQPGEDASSWTSGSQKQRDHVMMTSEKHFKSDRLSS